MSKAFNIAECQYRLRNELSLRKFWLKGEERLCWFEDM